MRRSEAFLPASRETVGAGSDAAKLLVRAGLIRPFGSGLWGFTPAGQRVREKLIGRVRAGMDVIGGQAVSLPGLQYRERWAESELLGIPANVVVGNTYREQGVVDLETSVGTEQLASGDVPDAVRRFAAGATE